MSDEQLAIDLAKRIGGLVLPAPSHVQAEALALAVSAWVTASIKPAGYQRMLLTHMRHVSVLIAAMAEPEGPVQ